MRIKTYKIVRPKILGILHNTGFPVAETSALASGL